MDKVYNLYADEFIIYTYTKYIIHYKCKAIQLNVKRRGSFKPQAPKNTAADRLRSYLLFLPVTKCNAISIRTTREAVSQTGRIKPNPDCNYTFPIDLTPK